MPLIQILFCFRFHILCFYTKLFFFLRTTYDIPFFTVVDLGNSDLYVGIWLKKWSIGGKTRDRVLFLAAACFSTNFFLYSQKLSRNKKVVTVWFKQSLILSATLYFFFLFSKHNLGVIDLDLEIVIKLIKIFGLWSHRMVHTDTSDQLIMIAEGDCYQSDKVRTILRIICFYW